MENKHLVSIQQATDCRHFKDGNGKLWFLATDLALYLGWKNPYDAIGKYVPKTSRRFDMVKTQKAGNPQRMFIDYDGAMSLFEHCKGERGEQFRSWLKGLAKEKVEAVSANNALVSAEAIAKSTAFVAKNFQVMLEQMKAAEKRQDDKMERLKQEIRQEVRETMRRELKLISGVGESNILSGYKPIVSANKNNFRRYVSYVVGQIVKETKGRNEDTGKAFQRVYADIYNSFARKYNIRLGTRRINLRKYNVKASYMDVIEKDKRLCNLFCAWFDNFVIENQIEINDDFILGVS